MPVTVLTADVVRSRQGGELLSGLSVKLAGLEHPFLLTPFSVSRGDEVQAVCEGILEAPELVRQLRYVCRPLVLRVGIGIGEIESGRGRRSSWEMNGTAFIRAREALDALKRHGPAGPGRRGRSGRITSVSSGDPLVDSVAGAIFGLMDAIQARWTAEQWDAVHLYERTGTYKAAAQHLGIAFQNVQKRCRSARWAEIQEAEAALRKLGRMLAEAWSAKGSPAQG